MADGEEVTSTLTPEEILAHLTASPPVEPTGYADMAADDVQKTGYDVSKSSWDAELIAVQGIIDSQV